MADPNMTAGYMGGAEAAYMNPPDFYPGQTVAPINEMQQSGWSAMQSGADQAAQQAQAMNAAFMQGVNNPYMIDPMNSPQAQANMIGAGPQVQANMLGGTSNVNAQMIGDPSQVNVAGFDYLSNPYMDASVQAAMDANNENFMREIMPGMEWDAVGAGMGGSTRQGVAEGLAMGELADANANIAAQMYNDMYTTGMGLTADQRGQDIGMQTTNAANQLMQQQYNQAAGLQAAGMNQSDMLARQQANQQYGMQGDLANQALWSATQQANQQAGLDASTSNMNQWGNLEQANQDAYYKMYGIMPYMTASYSDAMMAPGETMAQIGNQQQAQNQAMITGAVDRYNFYQNQPWNQVNQYSNVANSGMGNTTTVNPAYMENPAAGISTALMGMNQTPTTTPTTPFSGGLTGMENMPGWT